MLGIAGIVKPGGDAIGTAGMDFVDLPAFADFTFVVPLA
jgi:hypothetical protein